MKEHNKFVGWKHCSKCGKLITLNYYPFNKTIAEELDVIEEEHQLNLCDYCIKEFAICDAKEITFGCCVGNDNVIRCDQHIKNVRE